MTLLVYGFVIYIANGSFFIIVAAMSEERAKLITNKVIIEIIFYSSILFAFLILINFLLMKKYLKLKKSILKSLIISLSTIVILSIIVSGFREQFIQQNKNDYQRILELREK